MQNSPGKFLLSLDLKKIFCLVLAFPFDIMQHTVFVNSHVFRFSNQFIIIVFIVFYIIFGPPPISLPSICILFLNYYGCSILSPNFRIFFAIVGYFLPLRLGPIFLISLWPWGVCSLHLGYLRPVLPIFGSFSGLLDECWCCSWADCSVKDSFQNLSCVRAVRIPTVNNSPIVWSWIN